MCACLSRYFQFNPLVLLWKLYIELNLAELIAKVVHASMPNEASRAFERQWGSRMETIISSAGLHAAGLQNNLKTDADSEKGVIVVKSAASSSSASRESPCPPPEKGILKTVELQVIIQKRTHEMVGDVEDGPAFM